MVMLSAIAQTTVSANYPATREALCQQAGPTPHPLPSLFLLTCLFWVYVSLSQEEERQTRSNCIEKMLRGSSRGSLGYLDDWLLGWLIGGWLVGWTTAAIQAPTNKPCLPHFFGARVSHLQREREAASNGKAREARGKDKEQWSW